LRARPLSKTTDGRKEWARHGFLVSERGAFCDSEAASFLTIFLCREVRGFSGNGRIYGRSRLPGGTGPARQAGPTSEMRQPLLEPPGDLNRVTLAYPSESRLPSAAERNQSFCESSRPLLAGLLGVAGCNLAGRRPSGRDGQLQAHHSGTNNASLIGSHRPRMPKTASGPPRCSPPSRTCRLRTIEGLSVAGRRHSLHLSRIAGGPGLLVLKASFPRKRAKNILGNISRIKQVFPAQLEPIRP